MAKLILLFLYQASQREVDRDFQSVYSRLVLCKTFRLVENAWNAAFCLNPWTPKSDQHLISPYNITPESHIYVARRKEMILN